MRGERVEDALYALMLLGIVTVSTLVSLAVILLGAEWMAGLL